MFGTGIPGFAITTTVVAFLTYATTFGLVKQTIIIGSLTTLWTQLKQPRPQKSVTAADKNKTITLRL